MTTDARQPFWNTTLAVVTALATLIGAVGGLIATAAAIKGDGDPGSAPALSATPASTVTPSPVLTASATTSPRPSQTPIVIEITADADSWWGPPGWSSGDDGEERHGDSEFLVLDWGCSEDSRGNGSKEDCGSGHIAVHFDLGDLPARATIGEAVLTLYSEEGGAGSAVYARLATSSWSEDGSVAPECDSSGQATGQMSGPGEDEWRWNVTEIVQEQRAGGEEDLSLCLLLKEDGAISFTSREGSRDRAPVLAITYSP